MQRRTWGTAVLAAIGVTAAAAGITMSPEPAEAAPAPVPVEIRYFEDGTFLPVVEIEIGGIGLSVMLDTGSQGLVVNPGRLVDASPQPTITDVVANPAYDGTDITGTIALAHVTIGDLTTPTEIPFVYATSCSTPFCLGGELHLDGILGVSQGENVYPSATDPQYHWYSAIAQLEGDAAQGHTITLGEEGGTLELGRPSLSGSPVTVLQAQNTGSTYPHGAVIYEKPVETCWTIVDQTKCLKTTLDSGERSAVLMGSQFAPWTTPLPSPSPWPSAPSTIHLANVNPGTVIGFAKPGEAPFWSRTVAPADRAVGLYTDTNHEYLNSGNVFYVGRSVGFDNATGQVLVGPSTGTPGPVRDVMASVGDARIDVAWKEPAAHETTPTAATIESTIVQVRRDDGHAVRTLTLAADARTTVIDGLETGRTYTVEVAAANAFGLGPWTMAPHPLKLSRQLPATGTTVESEAWWALAALALGATAISIRAHGVRRGTGRSRG